jgi:aminopeptidase YwaD
MIADGDFDIPSVYMTDTVGRRVAQHGGQEVQLHSVAERIPATGCNVVALKGGDSGRRVVLFAHIDAWIGTPGATDDAGGISVLLLLAELLAGYAGSLGIEIVAMNGEDYYSAPGEKLWLEQNDSVFGEIVLGINLDDVGYHKGKTAYSLYHCPPGIEASIRGVFSAHPEMVVGEPWYQGDHGLFLMNQVPALAITSERMAELMRDICHTPKDTPEIVESAKLVDTALALRDLVLHLERLGP